MLFDTCAAVVTGLIDRRLVGGHVEEVRTRRIFRLRDFGQIVVTVLVDVGETFVALLADSGGIVIADLIDVRALCLLGDRRSGNSESNDRCA